jgi:putative nucleotidyltransferase with HDIG domain
MSKLKKLAVQAVPYVGILIVLAISIPKMMDISQETIEFVARIGLLVVSLGVFSYLISMYFYDELKTGRYQLMYWVFILIGFGPSLYMVESIPYLVPLVLGTALITSLIHVRLGFITNIVMLTLLMIVAGIPFQVFVIYLLAGTFVSIVIPLAKTRSQYVYVALAIAVLMSVLAFMTMLVMEGSIDDLVISDILLAGLNGGLVVIIAIGSEPVWEVVFKLPSKARLHELSNINQPLLKRLLNEAPGTYHHSMRVADLAERAAAEIGCNQSLARAGAMYHDIGKIKRAEYFTENQEKYNIHDDLSPDASATYIKGHVAEGVRLAKEYKLPRQVTAIIQQHHGNNRIEYFYQKAVEHSDGFEIDEKIYSYDGPRPESKEAVIVMLADCVEAASKSLSKEEQTIDQIKLIIQSVLFTVFKNNQLNHCPLRFDELPIIANAFLKVFNGMFHERVKYKTDPNKAISKPKETKAQIEEAYIDEIESLEPLKKPAVKDETEVRGLEHQSSSSHPEELYKPDTTPKKSKIPMNPKPWNEEEDEEEINHFSSRIGKSHRFSEAMEHYREERNKKG